MSLSWVLVGLLVAGIACLPYLVRWFQSRNGAAGLVGGQSKVVSVLAVGPQQRVVTIKVSCDGRDATLVLGVTAASISCLHKWEPTGRDDAVPQSGSQEMLASHAR